MSSLASFESAVPSPGFPARNEFVVGPTPDSADASTTAAEMTKHSKSDRVQPDPVDAYSRSWLAEVDAWERFS